MRFFIAALALAASTSASVLQKRDYPACAATCLANPNIGNCDSVSDLSCVCKSDVFISSVSACFNQACSGSDLEQANDTAQSACKAVGIDITAVPTVSGSATAPASSATSPTSASITGSTAASPSATPSTTSSGAGRTTANILAGGAFVAGAFFAL